MWYGDYFGVMSFEVNTKVVTNVPKDWADLLKPEYKKSGRAVRRPARLQPGAFRRLGGRPVAQQRQPRQRQGRPRLLQGAQRCRQLRAGHRQHGDRRQRRDADPPRLDLQRPGRQGHARRAIPPIEVVVPTSGRFGGMYVQAISKYAPHPNAAKLWMEYLYSDEGQNIWLSGYCNPIRYDDMAAKGTLDHGRAGRSSRTPRGRSCRPWPRSPPRRRASPRAGRPSSASPVK